MYLETHVSYLICSFMLYFGKDFNKSDQIEQQASVAGKQ
jgi:hypothetical protein